MSLSRREILGAALASMGAVACNPLTEGQVVTQADGTRGIIRGGKVITAGPTPTAGTLAPSVDAQKRAVEQAAAATPTPVGALSPAEQRGGQWVLSHPDQDKVEARRLPEGFTPDKNLHFATDFRVQQLPTDLQNYHDWERVLNTGLPVGQRLAGYNYNYNDWCQTADGRCRRQLDMYAWTIFQGQAVEVPGIGRLEGGPRKSVVLLVLNLDGSVVAFDPEEGGHGLVYVKRGFTATGRIWDGERGVDRLERNLSAHWLAKQRDGEPSKSYIGITDHPDNATSTLLVTVQRKQWGNNPDGSKRMEFQLLRAEEVRLK